MQPFTRTVTGAGLALGVTAAAWTVACAPKVAAVVDHCAARLTTFDTLDFAVYSGQKWDRFTESHSPDIVVTWPDGHETKGLPQHIADLKAQFVYAPDTRIAEHPIRICSGDWTSVTGVMTGTFSQPMPVAGGKSIPPTGKAFKLPMATIGHWNGSTMDHEWLFWDNHTFMQQIGLAQ
ncbi:MAG: ester cyclase [Gemmatimonadales bacterium]